MVAEYRVTYAGFTSDMSGFFHRNTRLHSSYLEGEWQMSGKERIAVNLAAYWLVEIYLLQDSHTFSFLALPVGAGGREAFQIGLCGFVVGVELPDDSPEARAVVHFPQMGEFVGHHVIDDA